ncbi:hypothetical protein [Mycobacterium sp. 236(2023)]|uniref:hypothetical protein n=1 Tax=Mycobacterium sp. 236(2023) TaxID=3038163 RepID=UPI0024153404|nr:hypothetical protein [Mycobacterium sp. 236(2023)]MDG4665097.1 hypothetical protein [Mycobacterium sp. 236(2023)]
MKVSNNAFRKLIKGTFLATLLLAAQEGGRPFHEATWILVGAVLTSVVDAYATHMSAPHDDGFGAYFGSLYRGLLNDAARTLGALPTVVLLVIAGTFGWPKDEHHPGGGGTAGYETVILNANVLLLFIFGILAAHRSGSSWRGTLMFALMNAALGWLIVIVELALD